MAIEVGRVVTPGSSPAGTTGQDTQGAVPDGLRPGQEAEVRVAVTTLWADPAQIRPVDAPALAASPDIPAWAASLTAEQLVSESVVSQLLLGERVRVEQVRSDGWVRITALEQSAADLDPDGYPGWLPAAHLAPVAPLAPVAHRDSAPATRPAAPADQQDGGVTPPATAHPERPDATSTGTGTAAGGRRPGTLVVDALRTDLRVAPAGAVLLPGVVLGTRLDPAGPARDGWQPVRVPGTDQPGWLPTADVVPLPDGPASHADVVEVARRLLGTRYLWGGLTAAGIDCSGLILILGRRFGHLFPRDALNQAEATSPVPLGTEHPGDLYFFARPGQPIHHVGVVAASPGPDDDRRMVHACYRSRREVDEQLPPERTATLIGAHRINWPTSGD